MRCYPILTNHRVLTDSRLFPPFWVLLHYFNSAVVRQSEARGHDPGVKPIPNASRHLCADQTGGWDPPWCIHRVQGWVRGGFKERRTNGVWNHGCHCHNQPGGQMCTARLWRQGWVMTYWGKSSKEIWAHVCSYIWSDMRSTIWVQWLDGFKSTSQTVSPVWHCLAVGFLLATIADTG